MKHNIISSDSSLISLKKDDIENQKEKNLNRLLNG